VSEESPETDLPPDLFHRGVVSKLFPSNNLGVVRTESGREVQFAFDLVVWSATSDDPRISRKAWKSAPISAGRRKAFG